MQCNTYFSLVVLRSIACKELFCPPLLRRAQTCSSLTSPPPLQAELKKEAKAAKADLKAAKESHKALKGEQAALEAARTEVAALRALQEAHAADIAAAQAGLKVWEILGGEGGRSRLR